ncbi:LutC/YkgG family protein [Halalkalibacter akibai]|uniref:Lactate utilization protein C n=1 Tax=Halalkalibacter akibai (strain ATCC 43226 / DSM 21942 / CIP 109018 / JCM 9157 / 1139) TaxID=1236973 RepID=W4QVS5_HALA3|nr:lactate utilization protein C [Halalkalibacter akibai]GAE35987.1 L-lactate dehydrogenase [Halalkalibacter akibai JCM 9157]
MPTGSIQHKDRFLDQIAKSLGRPRKTTPVVRPNWKHQPQHEVFKGYNQDQLVDVLVEQCTKIHTQVELVTTKNLQEVLRNVIAGWNAQSIISWDDPRIKEYELDAFFQEIFQAGVDVHEWNPAVGEENIKFAEQADIGITFADMTLAESGTVVLFSDQGKGRSVSLLPTYYIAVIPKSTIVPRMTQATSYIHQMQEQQGTVPSCINFISGPSNSADIEMNLVVGVHGPVKAYYLIVEDK